MAKKKQNISLTGPLSWNTIKVYLSGELSDKEMYNLERKIQNEPFEQEAFDGFYEHAPASMETDLDNLREKIARKTGNRLHVKRAIAFTVNWKLVAAVAALIIVVPIAVYLFVRSGNDEMQLAQNTESASEPIEQALERENEEASFDAENVIEEEEVVPLVVEETIKREPREIVKEEILSEDLELKELSSVQGSVDIFETEAVENNRLSSNKKITHLDVSSAKAMDEVVVEESLGASASVEEQGVAVDVRAKSVEQTVGKNRDVLSRTPALAPGGLTGYKAYLKSQILSSYRNLDGNYKIKLLISESGVIEEVEILEGVSRRADNKMVKIIKGAPAWTPANEKGENVSDIATFSLSLD